MTLYIQDDGHFTSARRQCLPESQGVTLYGAIEATMNVPHRAQSFETWSSKSNRRRVVPIADGWTTEESLNVALPSLPAAAATWRSRGRFSTWSVRPAVNLDDEWRWLAEHSWIRAETHRDVIVTSQWRHRGRGCHGSPYSIEHNNDYYGRRLWTVLITGKYRLVPRNGQLRLTRAAKEDLQTQCLFLIIIRRQCSNVKTRSYNRQSINQSILFFNVD